MTAMEIWKEKYPIQKKSSKLKTLFDEGQSA